MQLKGILSRNHHPLHHCLSLSADLGNVRTHVSSVKDALDSYNGGVWGLMSIANKLNSARNSICSARSELDSLEMMTGLDFEDWSEAYDELHSVMVDTLHSADGKVCIPRLCVQNIGRMCAYCVV